MNPSEIHIIPPLFFSTIIMFLSLGARVVVNSGSFKPSNKRRGRELFRLFFIGPDLAILSLSLLVSSQVLKTLLNGRGVKTNFGDNFGTYFGAAFGAIVTLILFSIACWLVQDDDDRQFTSAATKKKVMAEDGTTKDLEVWKVDWRASFSSPTFYLSLLLGDILGGVCVLIYCLFLYTGFVTE